MLAPSTREWKRTKSAVLLLFLLNIYFAQVNTSKGETLLSHLLAKWPLSKRGLHSDNSADKILSLLQNEQR